MSILTSGELIALLTFSEERFGPSGIYVHDEESEWLAIGPKNGMQDHPVSEYDAKDAQELADSLSEESHVTFDPERSDPWTGTKAPAFIFLAGG